MSPNKQSISFMEAKLKVLNAVSNDGNSLDSSIGKELSYRKYINRKSQLSKIRRRSKHFLSVSASWNTNNNNGDNKKYGYDDGSYSRGNLLRVLRINNSAMENLRQMASDTRKLPLGKFSSMLTPDIILTGGAWTYREALFNWIAHVKLQHIRNYIVLCFDKRIFDSIVIESDHKVLVLEDIDRFAAALNKNMNGSADYRKIPRSNSSTVDGIHYQSMSDSKFVDSLQFNLTNFQILMNFKYTAIATLLHQNISVLWSDADSLIIRKCALNIFNQIPIDVDVIAQSGLSPFHISKKTGVTLCTGYFLSRPTVMAKALMQTMREKMFWGSVFDKYTSLTGDDQSRFNEVVYVMKGFRYLPFKPVYGDGYGGIVIMSRKKNFETVSDTQRVIKIAILPYSKFPRGRITATLKSSQLLLNVGDLHGNRNEDRDFDLDYWNNSIYVKQSNLIEAPPFGKNISLSADRYLEQGLEWRRYANHSCVWHMLAEKKGNSKVIAMKRDGVWMLDTNNLSSELLYLRDNDEIIDVSESRWTSWIKLTSMKMDYGSTSIFINLVSMSILVILFLGMSAYCRGRS